MLVTPAQYAWKYVTYTRSLTLYAIYRYITPATARFPAAETVCSDENLRTNILR